jgi:hypothetical protein
VFEDGALSRSWMQLSLRSCCQVMSGNIGWSCIGYKRQEMAKMSLQFYGARRDVSQHRHVIIACLTTRGAEPFLRSRQLYSHSRTPQHFMEPEGSIPCSQEPSTGPYPEPYQSSPHHRILSLEGISQYRPRHLRLGLPSCLFPSGFQM